MNDRICERHFTKDQILTHWDHVIDGKLVQLEREKPRLKDNAIPQLNLEVRHAHTKRSKFPAPKKPKVSQIETKISIKDAIATDKDFDTSNDIDNENHLEMPTSDEEVVDVRIENLSDTDIAVTDTRAEETDDNYSKRKTFEIIYDDIYEVVLPSTLWGIHRDPDQKFIAFTQFDPVKMNCSKTVYVSNAFEIYGAINGANVFNETIDELSVEYLSKMLGDLDEQQNEKTSSKS